MTWRYEDGGPRRRQITSGGLDFALMNDLAATTRVAPATTMVVGGPDVGLFLLRHTAGEDATASVERIDPHSLEP